jgi:hypothetical protein
MPKKLRPAVDLMAFKCRKLKIKGDNLFLQEGKNMSFSNEYKVGDVGSCASHADM